MNSLLGLKRIVSPVLMRYISFLIIVWLTNPLFCFSQTDVIQKYRAYGMRERSGDVNGDLKACDYLVVVKKNRVLIYSDPIHEFDVAKQTDTGTKLKEYPDVIITAFLSVDENGDEVILRFYDNDISLEQITIVYSETKALSYFLKKID